MYTAPTAGQKAANAPLTETLIGLLDTNPFEDDAPLSAYAGASRVLLDTQTASSSSSLDFTSGIGGTYPFYLFDFDKLAPDTDNVGLYMRMSTNLGVSWLNTNYDWVNDGTSANGAALAAQGTGAAQIVVLGSATSPGNASGEGITGKLFLNAPSSTSLYKLVNCRFTYTSTIPTACVGIGGGGYMVAATDIDAVQFYPSGGLWASGAIRMYGIKGS